MKLTRHNGRSGKHGTYNPRHNDRRFDVENSEHIDAERARQNVYWDCYRDAEPAMPVPTIPANNPVNTNSVEPIPAGAGITAASITDNAVIAMVSTRLIFLSPAKRRYGIPYQKQSFNRFKPITPATIFFLCRRYLEAASRSADYNETIGIGCDGAESLGEGLRQNMERSQAFIEKAKKEIPDIILENCASGGHRLEPSLMAQMNRQH